MIIRKETLEAVLPAASDDNSRYHLESIQINPDGRCVATDGSICLTAKDPSPFPDEDFPVVPGVDPSTSPILTKPILVPVSILKRLIAAMPKGKRRSIPILHAIQIRENEAGHTLAATDLQVPCVVQLEPKDETFPNTDRVMVSADRPHVKLILSTQVLKDLVAAAEKAAPGHRLPTITFEVQTDVKHREQIDKYDHRFSADLNTASVCLTDQSLCTVCGDTRKAHGDKLAKPNGQTIDQTRVTFGTEIKVEGVVMPCRV